MKKENDILYLAYGSNIGKKEMKYRCPNAKQVAKGLLADYKLEFRGIFCGYLTIKKQENSSIPVSLWKLGEGDKRELDMYEGLGTLYFIEEIKCEIDGKGYDCFAYIMNSNFDKCVPTDEYYLRCEGMYDEEGFSNYINLLDRAYQESRDTKS